MTDIAKLSTLLDDPEVRDLLFGLAHTGARPTGPAHLHSVVLRLAETTTPEQYGSWLSDAAHNQPMTVDQVRSTVGEGPLDDLATFAGGSSAAVAWQLASILPDLVDAASPGGTVIGADQLGRHILEAIDADDRSAGAFG
ncbi:YidB family protein [Actinoplanes sp. TRM 88003]|uniref:YidB family protein n=1 Tax=Paractinoplanes aksuensis TaxID=2939490 RepID=A0ABT1DHH0_9ACTN|nr:YidB family protein [Actinoplanes aksuensis]MCO8269938.1 YidB family protein [Actinoplanes aksuensis]